MTARHDFMPSFRTRYEDGLGRPYRICLDCGMAEINGQPMVYHGDGATQVPVADPPKSRFDPGVERELAFREFHQANPQVYVELVKLARHAMANGRTKYGMRALCEVLRWGRMTVESQDDWKLNNNHHSSYARLIMKQEPDLRGFFETREGK